MFDQNPFTSQASISLFLSFSQRRMLGFLERCLAVFVKFCQSLVASICQNPNVFGNLAAIILEELKIMFAPKSKGGCHNFGGLLVSHQLRFLSMSLLFATIVLFLVFFGRSIGCSLTSTSMTSKTVSLGWSAFLPGRRNLPEFTRASSIFRMVRQTVASLTT